MHLLNRNLESYMYYLCKYRRLVARSHLMTLVQSLTLLTSSNARWTTTQEKTISRDYPFTDLDLETPDQFVARTYLQFLWLPEVRSSPEICRDAFLTSQSRSCPSISLSRPCTASKTRHHNPWTPPTHSMPSCIRCSFPFVLSARNTMQTSPRFSRRTAGKVSWKNP